MQPVTPEEPCGETAVHGPHEWLLLGALRTQCPGYVGAEGTEEFAGAYFDEKLAPDLRTDGVPGDALDFLRRGYVKAITENPIAFEQLRAWHASRERP